MSERPDNAEMSEYKYRSKYRYIDPTVPAVIRGLWKSDPSERTVRLELAHAADLIQELLDMRAAAPHLRAAWEEEVRAECARQIRDYWDACGDLIDSHNGARLAFDAIIALLEGGGE